MDVSLTVTLMRDQLGTVIEQAVTVAVETVLGEMVRVVGCKLEEYSKEMTAKEKENESIRQMLEISQCQMKTMRKYLSAVIAKDERHALMSQRNSVCKQNEPNRTYRPPAGESQLLPGAKRTNKGGDGGLTVNAKAHNPLTQNQSAYASEGSTRALSSSDRSATKPSGTPDLAKESATRGREDSHNNTSHGGSREASEHAARLKEESRERPEGESGSQGKEDTSEPAWGARQLSGSQGERPASPSSDTHSLLKTDANAVAEASASTAWDTPMQAKEEQAEIEIICIKEEPEDLELYPVIPQCPGQGSEEGSPLDIIMPPDTEDADELREAAFAMSGLMYGDIEKHAGAQRQARWRHRMRDPGLYEDHRHRKAELKRRSQHRRREREKSLPQPLLAALERERREKNRIRVARWRAKRKLQAGLAVPQAAPFGCAPAQTGHAQQNDKLHCHPQYGAAPQASGLLYGSAHCENGTLFSSLPFGSNPLLPGLRHDT
ncbi:uncharacterized protein LOC118788845 [Megalops cyprinoides]|uniref:uncharacterized protein LOC118788845 n=1 Tax=Megalops cyprinoides TaxID=118141 RepID=UPI0018654E2D|nr:uncharacterized protein LOC118788845 [Megalops cyprinoides]